MAFPNLNFYHKTKLKFASKVFPVKVPSISLLDNLDLDLPQTKINQIKIPSISLPKISDNYCPEKKDTLEIESSPFYIVVSTCKNEECGYMFIVRLDGNFIGERVRITCPQCEQDFITNVSQDYVIHDLSIWIKDQLFIPEIESISLLSKKPRKAGKLCES